MPNTTYTFATVAGTTIAFDPATDVLAFGAGLAAARLSLSISGSNLIVTIDGQSVTLTNMSLEKLRTAALAFADGSTAQVGDALATVSTDSGKNTLTGTDGADYLNGLGGDDVLSGGKGNDTIHTGSGTDTVTAGEGDDTIIMAGELAAADRIDGGAGTDTVRLAGNYNLTFVDGTLSNVENLVLEGDGLPASSRSYRFTTHDATVADGATLAVDGAGLDASDTLYFDGSAEVSGRFNVTGGAGSDTLIGGAGIDTLKGGAGADTIDGGQGGDVLTGGAGNDVFIFRRGTARSDSSPTTADRITDFEGAGVLGGDLIRLPIPSGGKQLAFAGYKTYVPGASNQAPNVGDGFADVFYDHFNGQTRIVIDVDDNGVISEVDQVIILDGIHDLQPEDFDAAFSVIRGTEGADDILGSTNGETIFGQGGNDTIDGNAGSDTINGGAGQDTLYGNTGSDTLNGDADNDTLYGGDGVDTLYGGDADDTLNGEGEGDNLYGGAGKDKLYGGAGGDSMRGDAGDDTLWGGDDIDTMYGGDDNDTMYGQAGNDTINGDAGTDTLYGGDDNDTLRGGSGADTLYGDAGNDTLMGGIDTDSNDGVADTLYGGEGADTLYTGTGRDVLSGGAGADKFIVTNATSSAANPNRITDFNPAEDKLQLAINTNKPLAWYGYKPFVFDGTFGNGGVQFPLAGDGLADAIWDYDAATNTTRIAVDVNDDGVFSTGDLLIYLDGQHNLTSSMFTDTFTVFRGGAGNDVMPGTEGVDTYYGMGGDDTITGEGGNDTLYGGDDNDTIDGGQGDDNLYGDAGNDILTGGAGVIRDDLYGGAGNDQLDGQDGDDFLYGGDNNDELRGSAGNDNLYGGAGDDKGWGGIGDDYLYGGDNNDQLWGDAGKDNLQGDAGDDTLYGGTENDTLYGGGGNDTLYGGDGNDTMEGGTGTDVLDAGAGDDSLRFSENDTVTGGTGADTFWTFYNSDASTLSNFARITDFQQGLDKLAITGINGNGKTFVFNPGSRLFGPLVSSGAGQTVLGNGGDGLHDIFYSIAADGLSTTMIVDLNDDGKLDASDLVFKFDGAIDFTMADFVAGTFQIVRGSEGADTLTGTVGVDTIYGVGGNDTISGLAGKDVLYGGAGQDTIDGGADQDTLYGGDDNDTLTGGDGDIRDDLYGDAGNDMLYAGGGDDYVYGGTDNDTMYGGTGADTMYGGAGIDTIYGEDGNDGLEGGDGDDFLYGGLGKDTLSGNANNDTLDGGDQDDTLYGGAGNDTLVGGEGNDSLEGGDGVDIVQGGNGADGIHFGDSDVVTGGAGADTFWTFYNSNVSTFAAATRITDFTQGEDKLAFTGINGNGKNYVFNAGNRALGVLSTSGANQTILGNGGDGLNDILYTYSADGQSTYLILDVNDDGKLDAGDVVVKFDGQIDFTTADFQDGTFKILRGSDNDDVITGSTGDDTIYGLGGKDTINGGQGKDLIYGAAGDDVIDGGLAADDIYGGDNNDTIYGGAGTFNDFLRGEAGDDVLDGGDGDDNLYGGTGKDTLTGGLGGDSLYGHEGEDALDGGEGNDTLYGGDDNDTLTGGLGDDNMNGDAGDDTMVGGDGKDTMYGGTGADKIYGGDGNDVIDGGAGADIMEGGIGDDSLRFGAGDTATGGAGADTFWTWYNSSDVSVMGNAGRIVDFQQGVDKLSIQGVNGQGKRFAVDPVALQAGLKLGDALPFGGDEFHDIAFSHETGPNGPFTRVYVDLDDDGKLDADDLVFDIAGHVNLTAADFWSDIFLSTRGTPGNDTMLGTTGVDSLWGVDGNDTIRGGLGNDSLYGQNGTDALYGEEGTDYLYGGLGNDNLYGGIDYDYLYGGGGEDRLEGNEGDDNLYGGTEKDTLIGGFGADQLFGGDGDDSMEGGADNDTLYGDDGNDILLGQDGADTIYGGDGNDTIQGGALADVITGGKGNDTIDGGTEIDTVVFSGKIAEYVIIAENGGITVRDLSQNGDGTDFLTNVEKLQFSDGTAQGAFLTASDAAVVEGDNGQKYLAYTVSLIGGTGAAVSVSYQTTNGTALAGSDYTATSGTLTFGPNETSKTVLVPIAGDTVNEVDETLNLTLNNASGAMILDAVGVGTILNDDVTASIANVEIVEGNTGTKTLVFKVTLDKAAVGPVSVSYQTVDGTASAGSDYVGGAGLVQFAAGETSKEIRITINGDKAAEADETFLVKLLSATGGKIGVGQATGTILNDDLNNAPIATADSFTVEHATALQTTAAELLANDTDPDGNTLTLVSVQDGVHGTVALVDGKIVFTPAADYSGPASFTYTVSDGTTTSTGTVNVTVKEAAPPPNEAPVSQADSYTVAEDQVLSVPANTGVLANDTDANPQDVLHAVLVQGPQHGQLTLNPDGSFVYRPADNYNGPDSFTYKANDGTADGNPVTVNLNVTAVNDAAKGTADSYTIDEDGTLSVTAANGVLKNDSDVDGDTITAQLVTGPANGQLTLNPDGSFTYVPKANYNGTDSFTYRPMDGKDAGAPVTVTLKVNAVNDAPDAVNDTLTTAFGTPVARTTAQLLANDKDVDGDAMTLVSVQDAVNGTVELVGGTVTFTPTAGYSGPASYTYTISDGKGGTDTATVTITVAAAPNSAPVGTADSYTVAEDGTLTVNAANGVLKNDSDANGDAITAQLVTNPAHGSLTFNADGSFTYKPVGNYNGADSFTYRPTDGKNPGAPVTVTLNVTAVNDAPDAVNDTLSTSFGTPVARTVAQLLANDTDADGDSLAIVSVQSAVNGTVALVDGVVTFTPTAGYSGPASYTYTISDGKGGTDTATVNITIAAAPNSAPVGTADSYSVAEDGTLTVNAANGVLKNDSDANGDAITAQLVSNPVHGSLTFNVDGSFTYKPAGNYNGPDSFTYRPTDGKAAGDPVTVTLNVTSVNDAPDAVNDTLTTSFGTPVARTTAQLLANDTDADGDTLAIVSVQGAVNGTVALVDGVVSFTPTAGYSGPASYTYTVSDGHGGTDTATVNITVGNAPNNAPVGNADNYSVAEDGTLTVNAADGVLKNDTDANGDTITAQLVSNPAHGSLTFNADGSFTYKPTGNYNGPDSFTYRPTDGKTAGDPVTVNLDVTAVNDAPKGAADTYAATEDTALIVNAANGVLKNDSDVDGDTITAELVTGPKHGVLTLNADGSFSYTPAHDYAGPDSFAYRPTDGKNPGQAVTVTLNVAPVDDKPEANPDSYSIGEDGTLTINAANGVLKNDREFDGNVMRAELVSGPATGQLTLNADGSFVYTPAENQNGPVSFTYRVVENGTNVSDPTTVTINVTPVNDNPDAVNDGPLATGFQTALVTNAAQLLANDTDIDGDTLAIVSVGNAVGGSVSLVDGVITFVPASGFWGAASYSYTVSDGKGGTDTATVTVQVGGPASQDDLFFSTAANETFDGGGGNDTVSYAGLGSGVNVSLSIVGPQVTKAGGLDTLIGIENLIGTASADQLTGDGNANVLKGGDGNDVLYGMDGDDVINGGLGRDRIYGGDGSDTVSYADATSRVEASLATRTGTVGEAAGDGFSSIENLTGSAFNDRLEGDATVNVLNGGAGDDVLVGNGGADVLIGGEGADSFLVSGLAKLGSIDGGAGFDTILAGADGTTLIWSNITGVEAVSANGFGNVRIIGDVGDDVLDFTGITLSGVASIEGRQGNDIIVGSAGDDVIDGGSGLDVLSGGGGNDRFVFGVNSSGRTADMADSIRDFSAGDLIDLSGIDAIRNNAAGTEDAFAFIGTTGFSGVAGQLRYEVIDGDTYVMGDTDGNKKADFMIHLESVTSLADIDFVL